MSLVEKAFAQAKGFDGAMLECKAPSMPEAKVDNAEIRRLLYKYFPKEQVDRNEAESVCPYCGHGTPGAFKIYQHPKDKDCVGIYTCDSCRKRFVKQTPVHAEVW